MEKVTLRNYIFENIFSKTEGISLKDIASKSDEITTTFIEFKDILIRSGLINRNEKVFGAKKVKRNNKEYLIIKKASAEYIIYDLTDNRFLNKFDKDIFDQDFFIATFNENPKIDYKSYMFNSNGGEIKHVLEYFYRNQKTLELDKLIIYFSLEDEIAKTIVYYSIITGETIIHFNTADNMSNNQIYLYRGFIPADSISTSLEEKIPNIKVPKNNVPNYLLNDKIKAI